MNDNDTRLRVRRIDLRAGHEARLIVRSTILVSAIGAIGCATTEPLDGDGLTLLDGGSQGHGGATSAQGGGSAVGGGSGSNLPGVLGAPSSGGAPGAGPGVSPPSSSPPATCGNGTLDANEACDGANLNGATCASATLNAQPSGTLRCGAACQLDTSGCTGSSPGASIGSGGASGVAGSPGMAGSSGISGGGGTGGEQGGSGGVGNQGAGGSPTSSGGPTKLPTAASCPTFTNGGTVQIARANGSMMPVVIYVDPAAKSKPSPGGPVILYYHATLSSPAEVHQGFGDANIAKVTAMGGVVAAFTTTACSGCSGTDDGYWFVEDNVVQDTVVACAIQQANIDTRHIHALGWSAGALHTDTVAMLRSNYMASVISYSGGYGPWPGTMTPQDPSNHVASIQTYGDSTDVVVVSFPTQSKQWYSTFQPLGYYTMMCNHPGGHEIDPGVAPVSLQFFMDHPYKVSPEPYATTIPSTFPSYCKNSP